MDRKQCLFYFLLLRIASVFFVKTSYVPDEYWQSLEVAHNVVFGYGYLTWEWRIGLRNYLYPALISAIYKGLRVFRSNYRILLVTLPRILQAIATAVGDVYAVAIARELYGETSSRWTFRSLMVSWFMFYCGSRTLTNTMETALTCATFYYYPCLGQFFQRKTRYKTSGKRTIVFLSLAALTVLIRPTSAVLWAPLCVWHLICEKFSYPSIRCYATVGSVSICAMVLLDRIFYGYWVCSLYNFLHFNVLADQGSFYGSHPVHWYLSQGFPVVMATHLAPFLLEAVSNSKSPLLTMIVWQLIIYSFISHKEFRFIMPVLPFAMCLVGKYLASVGRKAKVIYALLVITNIPLMIYFGLVHQRAPLDCIAHLAETVPETPSSSVLFLMPCHSVPLYSHLHLNISVRFLTCEPNLNKEANYMDEADTFYNDPAAFLIKNYENPAEVKLPSHIIMFDNLAAFLPVSQFIHNHGYALHAQYFHSHFVEGRTGKFINIYLK